MNILITRFPFESAFGGEEWHTIELAKELRKRGHALCFLGSCPVLLKLFREENFKTFRAWGGKMVVTPLELMKFFFIWPLIFFSLRKKFRKVFRQEKIETLYCLSLNEKIFLTPVAKKYGIKVIWMEHQQIRSWLTKNPLRYLYKKYSKYADIVPISPWNKKKLVELGIQKNRIVDIPNGVKPFGTRKETQEKKTVVGCASRLIEKKGMEFVIRAAIELEKRKTGPIEIKIIGEGEEEENLKKIVTENHLNNIRFLGRLKREEYEKQFLTFDIFVLPSTDQSETFGLVAAEAMRAKIPTVITDVCGIARYLKNEKNSMIIPPKNSERITDAIQKLIQDKILYKKIAENARSLAEKKFAFKKMVDQYEKILK